MVQSRTNIEYGAKMKTEHDNIEINIIENQPGHWKVEVFIDEIYRGHLYMMDRVEAEKLKDMILIGDVKL